VTVIEPASFRDPGNQVFYSDAQVFRGLDERAEGHWRALAASRFFGEAVRDGRICATTEVTDSADAAPGTGLAAVTGRDWATVLRHERIPFVSYPYEWTFSMLRDAALLHLELLSAALDEGLSTTDGSAYNLQWRGSAPVFIDVGSFAPHPAGEAWAGYRQFCQTMLYPLMLRAHLDVPFQPWLRGRVDGIEADQMRGLFGGRNWLRPGVLTHVHLHGAMQSRNRQASTTETRQRMRAAGFSTELLKSTVRGLHKLVSRLQWRGADTHWADYRDTCTYTSADRDAKGEFVAWALASEGDPDLVLDLGANDGHYARLAAERARHVVAVEADETVADGLYRSLRDASDTRILPLVMDLADPSPGLGWAGAERAPFGARARADVVLALALVHHLAIGRNVPLPRLLDWLAGLGRRLIVEFVDPTDPMAARLLANKPAGLFGDYHRDAFERLLAARFTVVRRVELPAGTRTLYEAIARD
jgi:SAM-dependent methyltransferase